MKSNCLRTSLMNIVTNTFSNTFANTQSYEHGRRSACRRRDGTSCDSLRFRVFARELAKVFVKMIVKVRQEGVSIY